MKCFMKAGVLDRSGDVVTGLISDGEDPFADLDIAGAAHADLELLKFKALLMHVPLLLTSSVVIKSYRFVKSSMEIGNRCFWMVCRQPVSDLKVTMVLEVKMKEQTVMMGAMMSKRSLKSQKLQRFNRIFVHWKMYTHALTERDTLLLLATP